MAVELTPGLVVAATTAALEHEPLPTEQIVSGTPTSATLVLDERDGREIGVWEMSPGAASDLEADEVFVVLAGRARVEFSSVPDGDVPSPIDIGPGSVVRLTEGMTTTWTVHETLRKVYLA